MPIQSDQRPAPHSPVSMKKAWWLFVGVAAIVVGLVHGPSVQVSFLSDDFDWVTSAETHLAQGDPFGAFRTSNGGNFYRPLPAFSLTIDAFLGGRNVVPFHVHQVLLFYALVLAIAWLIWLTSGQTMLAWGAALVFAAYPSHHEVITWLAGRPDLMAALWLVVSCAAVWKWFETKRTMWFVAIIISTALALLSKEVAFVAPALHLGLVVLFAVRHRTVTRRSILLALVPSVLLLALALIVRAVVLTDAIGGYMVGGSSAGLHLSWRSWLTPFTSIGALINLPYLQSLTTGHAAITWLIAHSRRIELIVLLVAGLAVIGLALKRTNHRRWVWPLVIGLAWSVITFVPALGLSSAIGTNLEGSRLFFTPSIGYALIIATAMIMIGQLWSAPRAPWILIAVAVIVLGGLSALNFQPWRLASRDVRLATDRLNADSAELIPAGASDIIVSRLPSREYGAYAFWGPHIVRAIVRTVAGRPLHVFLNGNQRYPDSPFCSTDPARHIILLNWDTATKKWQRLTATEDRLAAARTTPASIVSETTWTPVQMATAQDGRDTRYTILSSASSLRLDPPSAVRGANVRSLTVRLADPTGLTSYGSQRATVTWPNAEQTRSQTLTYAPSNAEAYTIPLCQYLNWSLSESIPSVSVRPQQSGSFTLRTIQLSSSAEPTP